MYNPENLDLPDYEDPRLEEYLYGYDVVFSHALAFDSKVHSETPFVDIEFWTPFKVGVPFHFMMWPDTPTTVEAEKLFEVELLSPIVSNFSTNVKEVCQALSAEDSAAWESYVGDWYEEAKQEGCDLLAILRYRVRYEWQVRAWPGLTLEYLESQLDSTEEALDFSKTFSVPDGSVLLATLEPEFAVKRPNTLESFQEAQASDFSALTVNQTRPANSSMGSNTNARLWSKINNYFQSSMTSKSKSRFNSPDDEIAVNMTLWEKLTQPDTSHKAVMWFSEFEAIDLTTSGSEEMKQVHADFVSSIEYSFDNLAAESGSEDVKEACLRLSSSMKENNPKVFPKMNLTINNLSPLMFRNCHLGKKILAALDFEEINYLDVAKEERGKDSSSIVMRWDDTPGGNLNLQYVKIYADQDGNEFAFWHTHLLASNRPIDYRYVSESKGGNPFVLPAEGQRFVSPEGQYNLNWALPAVLKNIAYISEASSISNDGEAIPSRDLAFEGIPSKNRPQPAFALVSNETFSFTHDYGDLDFQPIRPSDTALFGWILTEESLEEFAEVLPFISKGCALALQLVEEGDSHNASSYTGLVWNTVLNQPAILASTKSEVYGQLYTPEWMTIPEYSQRNVYVMLNYNDMYSARSSKTRRKGFKDLLANGTDRYVPHAANSLVFREYLESVISSEQELEEALEILSLAYCLDFGNLFGDGQSTNALCNAGQLYYQVGKLKIAERLLKAVIYDNESGNEDEANFVLSLVYEELGQKKDAERHRELGRGYSSGSRLRKPRART